jgi:hypothetical protein
MSLPGDRGNYTEGRRYAGLILDWIEYQMTRKDADVLLP